MNKLKISTCVAALYGMLVLAGCSATTNPSTGATTTESSMVATLNGSPWSSTNVGISGGAIAIINTPTAGNLTVTGTSVSLSGTQTMGLVLLKPHFGPDSLGTGNTGTFTYGTNGKGSYVTAGFNAGSVNITKYDTTNRLISGTFSFTAHQIDTPAHVVTVTNGSFLDVGWSK